MENLYVVAKSVNKMSITFECPHCWTKYKKNGEPSLRAKRVVHSHGSCGDISNRIEHRALHCLDKKRDNYSGVNIEINDTTLRN